MIEDYTKTRSEFQKALTYALNTNDIERAILCEQSPLLFFAVYFHKYFAYKVADYHFDMSLDLKMLSERKVREVAWIMYRESAKTTFAKLYVIWLICYKKKKYINVDSFDKENAERILFDVVFELSNNKHLQADFGVLYSKRRDFDDVKQTRVNNFVTENGIRVEAHSTQESVRGRLHLEQRPDILILDDIETNKTKDSEAYTKQVHQHITEAMGGMSPDGVMLYLGNYITEYGNIQWLIDRAKTDDKLIIRNVPVVIDGKPAWPGKYAMTDQEAVAEGKVSIEDKQRQLGHLVFSYEMMNQPIDETIAEFKREWVKYTLPSMLDHMQTNCYITIDSAVSEKESADYTGITINKISKENVWYVKTYRMKMNSKDLIDHIFFLHDTYKPIEIGIEKTTFTLAIKPFFEDEMRKRNKFIRIIELEHKQTNKETRIRGLIPRLQSGSIIFLEKSLTLLDEMRTFPNGQHDDELDSLAYQLQVARAPFDSSAVPKPKPFNRFGV